MDLKTSQENHIRIHKDSGPGKTKACLEVSVLSDNSEAFSFNSFQIILCEVFVISAGIDTRGEFLIFLGFFLLALPFSFI